MVNVYGAIAQLVERLVRNEKVSGSTPLSSTTFHQSRKSNTAIGLRGFFMHTHNALTCTVASSDIKMPQLLPQFLPQQK